MQNETPTLIEPTLILRDDFYALAEEFLAEGDQRYGEAIADFEGFVQLCSDEAVGSNLAPAESHRVRFGSSTTGRGFSVVPDYVILSMHFSKRKGDTSATTFVRRNGGEDMELCFFA
jgi:hypothetical protein